MRLACDHRDHGQQQQKRRQSLSSRQGTIALRIQLGLDTRLLGDSGKPSDRLLEQAAPPHRSKQAITTQGVKGRHSTNARTRDMTAQR
jgi:hypothetical protein